MLNRFDFVGLEVNDSCPNTGHEMNQTETVIKNIKAVKEVSRHPIIVKVSVDQDYLNIAQGLKGVAEAISLNSVPWKKLFQMDLKVLYGDLRKKVSGGSGGVSGKPAQEFNWEAVMDLSRQDSLPVIGPSVMEFKDLEKVRRFGARAISFGAIHLRTPWKPTLIVEKEIRNNVKS